MTAGMRTIIYPVKDLARAKELYGKLLGREPASDQPYYVSYTVGDQQVGLDPNGHSLLAAGAQTQQDVRDVGGGRLIATVTDPDGNIIGLLQD